jgi:hypothetical protein
MKRKYGVRLIRGSRPLNGTFGSNVKLLDLERFRSRSLLNRLAEKHHTAPSGAV